MQKIISEQESLIKQFQRDVERQEGVISRYEKHIKQLEINQYDNHKHYTNHEQQRSQLNHHHISGSEFTDRESSSLQNPSSHYNQPVPI